MKRKNIIISSLALMLSITLMVFGVYSAEMASLNIIGQVSYTVTDVKVLVQGKVESAGDAVQYPTANTTNYTQSARILDSNIQYLDFTAGGDVGNADDDLRPWTLGEMVFEETTKGISPIKISFKLTNYSPYPIEANVSFFKTDGEAYAAKVSRSLSDNLTDNKVVLLQNGEEDCCKEITIIYKPLSDSVNIDAFDIGMIIIFSKAQPEISETQETINSNNGIIYMGKTADDVVEDDIQWRCFAYSVDGINFEKYTTGETVLTNENAKYCYFILDTYVSSMDKQYYCKKYTTGTEDDTKVYYNNNSNVPSNIYLNDYYYSEIRSFINTNAIKNLKIDTQNETYSAIIPRSVADLYTNNKFTGFSSTTYKFISISDLILPAAASQAEADAFWLLSMYELQEFFEQSDSENSSTDRRWLLGSEGYAYWTRSTDEVRTYKAGLVYADGALRRAHAGYSHGARVAFKMQVA